MEYGVDLKSSTLAAMVADLSAKKSDNPSDERTVEGAQAASQAELFGEESPVLKAEAQSEKSTQGGAAGAEQAPDDGQADCVVAFAPPGDPTPKGRA